MLTCAPIFSNHMVLQREKPIHIWGTGTNGELVTVNLGECACSAPVIAQKWEVTLPPLPAGGAYTLTIRTDTEEIIFSDIMIGEVWLCGGQSNMELALIDSDEPLSALGFCKNANVRLYHVCKRGFLDETFFEEEKNSSWQLPSVENCRSWTAIGYYFGDMLSKKLGVTVGLVECNYGGSSASAWISREMLETTNIGKAYLKDYTDGMAGRTDEEAIQAYLEYCEYQSEWEEHKNQCYRWNPNISWNEVLKICGENKYPGPVAPIHPLRPHGLYDTMISRIIPYTLRGVIYYQGEADECRPEGYETLLYSLIMQWRKDFRDDELPFLLVQLPMFSYEGQQDKTTWCILREAQEKIYKTVRNTGLAVILDCGEYLEIHPKEKRTPAKRLYLQALYHVYHLKEENTCSPMLKKALLKHQGVKLYFSHVDNGLLLKGKTGFELCDTEGNWHCAKAKANADTVFVQCDTVPYPTAVRYAWKNYAEVTLFEKNGLPAAPFRYLLQNTEHRH